MLTFPVNQIPSNVMLLALMPKLPGITVGNTFVTVSNTQPAPRMVMDLPMVIALKVPLESVMTSPLTAAL